MMLIKILSEIKEPLVTLSAIFTTLLYTSIEHTSSNHIKALVVLGILLLINNRDPDKLQDRRDLAALLKRTPASNITNSTGRGEGAVARRELNSSNTITILKLLRESKDSNIIIKVLRVVVRVYSDRGGADSSTTRVREEEAGIDTQVTSSLALSIVASSYNILVINNTTTIDKGATLEQVNPVEILLYTSLGAADNILLGEDAGEDGEEGDGGLYGG
ncbi:hypothetical protein ASPVEDRAFT_882534, partial [Aspergillus versicolor CBS 583.65]